MAETNTVPEAEGAGSDLFGESQDPRQGQPEGESVVEVDAEDQKIQKYLEQYKTQDGGIDVGKLAKEGMNAQQLLGRKGQEIGELKKQAEDLNTLMNYVNADPKRLRAWNKLISGDLEEGGKDAPVTSSEDLDKRLVEQMRAGKVAAPIKSVIKEYLEEAGLLNELQTVKKTQQEIRVENERRARNAQACQFLADLEQEGWTKKVKGAHYFHDTDLDAKFVELFNQGHTPENAFYIAKGLLGVTDAPKKASGKKKAATVDDRSSGKASALSASAEDDGDGVFNGMLRSSFEEAFGPGITKPKS